MKRVLTNAVAGSRTYFARSFGSCRSSTAGVPNLRTAPIRSEIILFDNVAYLVDDEKRAAAFQALKKKVGTRPEQILKASQKQLEEITRMGGIVPELRAQRLRQIAELAHYIFKDDLAAELRKPLPQAKKSLKRFPSIGDPGAEKILMLTRSHPVLALESNGLRVLVRLGFAEEKKSYSATYRVKCSRRSPDSYPLTVTRSSLPTNSYVSTVRSYATHPPAVRRRMPSHCGVPLLSDPAKAGPTSACVTATALFNCCSSPGTRFQFFGFPLATTTASGFLKNARIFSRSSARDVARSCDRAKSSSIDVRRSGPPARTRLPGSLLPGVTIAVGQMQRTSL